MLPGKRYVIIRGDSFLDNSGKWRLFSDAAFASRQPRVYRRQGWARKAAERLSAEVKRLPPGKNAVREIPWRELIDP